MTASVSNPKKKRQNTENSYNHWKCYFT
jgi:hypothetical protein